MSIKENLNEVNENLKKFASHGETPKLIAVTKTVDIDRIKEAIDCGVTDIGENKPQEMSWKYDELKDSVNYHMIGHLQSNKVKDVVGKACLIHSLDRMSVLKEIEKRASAINKPQDCLIQLNVAEEEQKSGLYLDDLDSFIEEIEKRKFVKVKGLMSIAPFAEDPEEIRWVFKKMREIYDKIKNTEYKNIEMKYLSMGMSHDYKVALEEGSNMVRVGSFIFGKRNYN